MNKNILRKLIIGTFLLLIIILSYKIYLHFHESDYQGSNIENISKLERQEDKEMFSFAVVGSAKNSIDIFQNKIVKNINSDNEVKFLVSTGNSVLDGAEDKYQILNNTLNKLKVPYLLGIGNSELSDGGDRRFYNHFGPFYYSFTYGNSYFIFIDSTGTTNFEVQKDWISSELTKADNYRYKFVFLNNSPLKKYKTKGFTNQSYIKDDNFSNFLINKFAEYDVTNVFMNGSVYEKDIVKGVTYYTSGGAGGLFLNNSANHYYLKANVSSDGITIHVVEVPFATNQIIIQKIENIWIYIHSIFYAQFINISLFICFMLLLLLLLYKKVSNNTDYYRNFASMNNLEIDKKLNIAMFTNNYLPFVGGVPISINRLAEALRRRGNNVIIFAPEYPGIENNKDNKNDENSVFRCKLLHYRRSGKFNFAIANIFSTKIDKEFILDNFDIVHVHHPFWMGKKGLRLGKKVNIPIVLTYHTRLEKYSENLPIFRLAFKNIVSHRMIRNFAQQCNGIIAPTLSAKEYLENVGVSRNKLVLPTGIDFEQYEKADEESIKNIRQKYAPDGEVLLCSVSRLSLEKNINFLIRGIKHVNDNTNIKFKFLLIGDGPERENIQKLIDECSLDNVITLVGSVKQEEIAKYYLASDIFTFSSLSETQGMVLLEAMAGRCPVVCVRSSGTDDVVRDGYNGFKTSENMDEWSEKVIYLLENQDILKKMSTNAYLYANNFSVDKMAEKVEMFYKKIISLKGNY